MEPSVWEMIQRAVREDTVEVYAAQANAFGTPRAFSDFVGAILEQGCGLEVQGPREALIRAHAHVVRPSDRFRVVEGPTPELDTILFKFRRP